ncbi:hypothetical protein [Leptospirillum ferriphilum]|uniref:hypothetical protein n=1 Tax=Leptospirillum ferriphilum TaxID=178606 RepID=UPI000B0307B5|nr:hypothetical protein [Leptospirillum ferriphilum]
MTPDILLRTILADACLVRLPMIEIRENEHSLWMEWEKRMSPKEIESLHRKEKRSGQPHGPQGHWAIKKYEFGRWYRPHHRNEVVVEWMNPTFFPDYVTVLSSGPFGGLYLVYLNEKFLALEMDSPFDDRDGMVQWMERFLKSEKPA